MNPEIEKMKNRIRQYKDDHPQYAHYAEPHVPRRKKLYTRKRLTGNEVCTYCGVKLTAYTATLDHVVPLSRGGSDSPSNLVWCCRKCNRSKGNQLVSEWYDNDNIF